MQQSELPELRAEMPEYKRVHSQVMQDVLRRLDRAFANYFLRIQRRKIDRRIKGRIPTLQVRVQSQLDYLSSGRKRLEGLGNGHVWLSKFGEVRTFMHRPMRGAPKTLTVKRDKVGDWFAVILCKIQTPRAFPVGKLHSELT